MLERRFRLAERGTTIRREVLGGVTTFATMAYIVVVNPAILSFAGLPVGPSTVATALTAAFGTLLMGVYANRPIAVAPYMGENAFVAFTLAALGATWPQMLGAVFVSGLAFLTITVLGIRGWLAEAISPSLKHSFAVGIGLFLTLIGLYQAGIVTSGAASLPAAALTLPGGLLRAPDVPLKIGALGDPHVRLAIVGFLIIAVLMLRRVRGSLLVGMVLTAGLGALFGLGAAPRGLMAMPFTGELSLAPLFLQLDVPGVLRLAFLPALLTLFLMGFLDTLGTLVGVGAAGGMLDERGDFPEIRKPMIVDALSCVFAGCVGTTTSGAYIESATGIREGARTGLAAIVTGALFLLSLFFVPAVEPLQRLGYAYAPALVAVGLLMVSSVRGIDFDDLTELVPAFATIVMMVFTYNIANGLTVGLVLHPLMKTAAGRMREVRAGALVLAGLCAAYFVFGLPH
ncbi:MAG: guanine permease [Acidobacteria bacterium RBG_16_70_10]|nr:MAG: guanine permease [Acidobacteria bacterium RBG_16_70_10]